MAARFVASAPHHTVLPDLGRPEICLVGRSNVGKSTLLGGILGRPKMVRTSRTPGRTQMLNLYEFGERLALVDLPGYGYAKLSHRQRAELSRMLQGYLEHRRQLLGVVQLLDARREDATELDREMAAFVLRCDRPLLLLITKSDLVAKTRRVARRHRIERAMGLMQDTALLVSGKTGEGLDELRRRLDELVSGSLDAGLPTA